jgi:hypothetical protein
VAVPLQLDRDHPPPHGELVQQAAEHVGETEATVDEDQWRPALPDAAPVHLETVDRGLPLADMTCGDAHAGVTVRGGGTHGSV